MFSSSKKAFTVACIAALAQLTSADQPVHCFKSQIAGHWTFEVSREAVHPNLYTADTICTHELPNKLQILPEDLEFTLPGHTSELYLLLNADYSVDVLDSCQGNPTGEKGNWTVVYDQAINVELPNRLNAGKSVKFTANMRYSLKPEIQESQYDDLTTGSYEAFNSRCTETMVGIKFNEDKMIQCWVGYQTAALTNQKPTEADNASPLLLAQTLVEETDAELELAQTAAHTKLGRYTFENMPVEARVNFAQTINKSNLTWKADPYLAQTDEADEGLMFAQTGAESYSNSKQFNDGSRDFQEALAEAQRYLNVDLDKINAADLPEQWSWEDVNGYNFSPRIYDQGHCGSCYLLANNGMLESRLKIWYGVDLELSIQQRMDCSFVNEGCHGGWGFFDGLFLENYGAVEDKCAPYEGSTSPEGCARWQNCKPVAGVKDTYYVGQRQYGKMSEEDMIKEVRARGPILFDFNAGPDFQAYKDGILAEHAPGQVAQTNTLAQLYSDAYCLAYGGNMEACQTMLSTQTQETMGQQWRKLTHSTLLIGYGVEPETNFGPIKYWLVRNSYGEKWGESGNLKILRGENQYGCESENIAIIPTLYK